MQTIWRWEDIFQQDFLIILKQKLLNYFPGYYMYSNIYLQQFHIFNHTVMLIVKGLTAEDEKTLSIEE